MEREEEDPVEAVAFLAQGRQVVKEINNNSQVEVKAEVGAKVVAVVEDEELDRYRLTLRQEEGEQTELLRKLKRRIKIIRRSAAQTPLRPGHV